MKAKCNICGKEMELEYTGHGMYQMSKKMEKHQQEHTEKVRWGLTNVEPMNITTDLRERLAEAHSDTIRKLEHTESGDVAVHLVIRRPFSPVPPADWETEEEKRKYEEEAREERQQ